MSHASRSKFYKLERIVKGFASHRRIEILFLLEKKPDLFVDQIAEQLDINFMTASDHLRKLTYAGLISKYPEGNFVKHVLTDRGKSILEFCKILR